MNRISASARCAVPLASLAALLGALACGSLLGIEDIHEGPAPGDSAGAGSIANAGAGGVVTAGGAPNPNGGKGGLGQSGGTGGSLPQAGSAGANGGEGGSAGDAGTAGQGGTSTTVHGHVIDFWGHHLPGVSVEIGGKLTTTDAQGAFTVAAVAAQYDASIAWSFATNEITRKRAWAYLGLTRRDPTLQVYEGLDDRRATLQIQPNNPPLLTDERLLYVAMGGPDGAFQYDDVKGAGVEGATALWKGPAETQETAHALIWQKDDSFSFPTKFFAYDSTLVALSSAGSAPSKASFDLSADTIATGAISGSVSGTGFVDRSNAVFLRFASNAVMPLLKHHPVTAGFSYVVPTLAGASATFAASEGDVYSDFALVHRDGLAANTALVNVAIPKPARVLAATPDPQKVDASTQFSFTASTVGSATFVASFIRDDPDERFYIVSAQAPFKIPAFVNGASKLAPGVTYYWRVETHGSPVSVDAMAGPTGFLDSFSKSGFSAEPEGPRIADGSYTLSPQISIKTAP